MRKQIFIFRKPYLGLAAVVIITILVIVAACMPTGLPTTGNGTPYIQSITAQIMPAGSATPGATASAVATGTPPASATIGATSSPNGSATAAATGTPGGMATGTLGGTATGTTGGINGGTSTPGASATAAATMVPSATATAAATGTPFATATASPNATATAAATGGSSVMISIQAANFTMSNNLGGTAVQGQGHVHYFLDTIPPIATGMPATTAPGTVVEIPQTTYTWPNVQPGLHVFSVELVNNDHTPLVVPAVASVMVIVPATGTAAAQQITSITATIMAGGSATPGATASAAATGTPFATATASPNASATAAATGITGGTATGTNGGITGGTSTPGASASAAATGTFGGTTTPGATDMATMTPGASATAAAIGGSSVMVTIQTNGTSPTSAATATSTGQGMFSYYLDALPPTFPNMMATTIAGSSVNMAGMSYTWPNVMPGVHILSVELLSNGMPMSPPVVAAVFITVPQAASGTATPGATASAAATGTTGGITGGTSAPGASASAAATGMATATSSTGF